MAVINNKNINSNADENICRILIGNKCDMEAKRQVDTQVAKEYAEQNNMKYYESSAKTGTNVDTLFLELASEIKQRVILTPSPSPGI